MQSNFVPQKDVEESLSVFNGWNEPKIKETMEKARQKVEELQSLGVTGKHQDQVAAVIAYTDETELYGGLNLTMRTKGGIHDKKLVVYGEYIYHLNEAIDACENYVGKVINLFDIPLTQTKHI